MINENQINDIFGSEVYASDGDKIGEAGRVYLDDETGRPEWVTVRTGLFGTNESFVPLSSAELSDNRLTVTHDKATVKDAPNVDPEDGHLSPEEEDQLYRYYGMDQGGMDRDNVSSMDTDRTQRAMDTDTTRRSDLDEGHDTSGPNTDDAMTLSEEQLKVGTERRETGRARLRKYVTTETETVNVPVTREEVRIEREPITDANRGSATSGPDISEEEHEITLHEERPVVDTEAVPVERVRLETDQVTDEEQVSGEVRKEHIEAEGVDAGNDQNAAR
ncbi:PRC and DUF2382 domain-containing protein [Knoellia sp. Soil729]|uniref:PRC and DUF2382 domain-containing protein n=1 Tax=Knoellia sp. Soil729 TaxID=1736394 RepID=UPI0006FF63D9|nr:PRC and DUF2382 domain-containing protein [Knoellia sp. Soil729]KRE43004.1 photosystem reaction center subunit H [Knoellia sp. Soil729]